MARSVQGRLQREWDAARAGRGGLVMAATSDDDRVASAVADLVAIAKRDGARVRRVVDAVATADDEVSAPEGIPAALAEAARLRRETTPQLLLRERVEDAGLATLRLLAALARELRDAPVLIVATRGRASGPSDPARERALADLARAGVWISLDASGSPAPAAAARPALTIVRNGAHWTVEQGGRRAIVRDSIGMRVLVRLVRAPGCRFRAVDLAERGDGDAGEALDAPARAAYRRELAALQEAGAIDPAARRDAEFLERALARDTGLRGRARRMDSGAERARSAIAQGVRRAIAAMRAEDAELARWVEASLHMGYECRFEPAED